MTPNPNSSRQIQIIPALRRIQDKCGYLNRDELKRFSKDSGIPLYRIQEVASFFPHFRLTPAPAVTVRVCRDMACHLAGAVSVLKQLRLLAEEGLCVEGASCLGRCDRAPAVCIAIHKPVVGEGPGYHSQGAGQPQEHEFYYLGRDANDLRGIIRACVGGKERPEGADSDAARPDYPSAGWVIDPYKSASRHYEGVKKLIAHRDKGLPWVAGGLEAPEEWVNAVFTELDDAHASLGGLGGAGVPAAQKWRDVCEAVVEARRRRTDRRAYVVVNGDESEPATFKDRELLLHFPHLIVEGLIVAGLVTGATEGLIYIRHEYPEQIAACEAEIRRAESQGLCGADAPVLRRPFPVSVFVSPGGYICGEWSALVEVMSDHRGEPRNLPPKLETNGLDDRPTLVSNVETFAWVPYILINGGKKYASLGVNTRKGRRFFSVSGDVKRPGVYEVPGGVTLRELICGGEYCQGIAEDRKLKAIAPSGPSGGFLPARLSLPPEVRAKREYHDLAQRQGFDPMAQELNILDLELDLNLFRALSPTQALGAGIVIYAEDRDMAAEAVNALEFFRNESCGKCVPCRVGSQKLANLGRNLLAGQIDSAEWACDLLPLVKELSDVMVLTSICGLGRSVPMPLRTMVDYFEDDVARHLT